VRVGAITATVDVYAPENDESQLEIFHGFLMGKNDVCVSAGKVTTIPRDILQASIPAREATCALVRTLAGAKQKRVKSKPPPKEESISSDESEEEEEEEASDDSEEEEEEED
jgi:hypothetical protein